MDNFNNRVLVVEDSPFMYQLLKVMLLGENFIVEVAKNGQEAIEKIRTFRPKVITMDIEMPVMSGLESLSVIMEERPTPVIMVSAQTVRDAQISLQALELGAFDIIAKPNTGMGQDIEGFRRELITKIKIAMLVPPGKLRIPKVRLPVLPVPASGGHVPHPVVLIGTSTGGPTALQNILCQLPKDFPAPILVVQHMPQNFTRLMAERLDSLCKLEVKEAVDNDEILPGRVLIAPGGMQMAVGKLGSRPVVKVLKESPAATPYKPSVNVLFNSAADIFGARVLAAVLTGMGSDGLEGARQLKQKKACLVAEAEETCVVYGMSKCLVDEGLADKVLPQSEIGRFLIKRVYKNEGSVGE